MRHVYLLFLLLVLREFVQSNDLSPLFRYAGQTLELCAEYDPVRYTECKKVQNVEIALGSSSQPYACTSDPATIFTCSADDDPGCRCKDSCVSFDTGWGLISPITDAACMPVNFQLEANWGNVSTFFLHDPGAGVPPQDPTVAPFPGTWIRCQASAFYGRLDLYHLAANCSFSDSVHECSFLKKDIVSNINRICDGRYDWPCLNDRDKIAQDLLPVKVTFVRRTDGVLTIRSISIIGSFIQITQALNVLKYQPDELQNTNRLKSRLYNPQFSKQQPYESLTFQVDIASCDAVQNISGCEFAPCVCTGNTLKGRLTKLVYIRDVNNAPTLSDPQSAYERPSMCTKGSLLPICHFGQFFSFEYTDRKVGIIGVQVDDVDISELCIYPQTECSAADLSVSALHGAVSLNTRDGVSFYLESRGSSGITAFMSKCNNAIRTIYFQVELTQNLADSSVMFFNTQTGSNEEYVSVIVSDQGASGASGVSQSGSLRINITIVAVNNPPIISINVIEYAPLEDKSFKFSSVSPISITDVDVADVIDSSLLRSNWTFQTENQINLNQFYVMASVRYGRLTTSYRRGLRLVQSERAFFITISARVRHDVCRLKSVYINSDLLTKFNNKKTLPGYKEACAFSNFGAATCPTGKESACVCDLDESECLPTSSGQGKISLFLRTSIDVREWTAALTEAVRSKDKTCGGLPYFPPPNSFTLGRSCETNDDCNALNLPACIPGETCKCCANITATCSKNSDCDVFDTDSLCGCVPKGLGYCGPYCDEFDICNTKIFSQIAQVVGKNCTFAAPWTLPGQEPFWFGFTEPAIRSCRSPAYTEIGSSEEKHLDTIGESQLGSNVIAIIGDIVDINRALFELHYLTLPQYNRRFRPPVSERDPLTFDIAADSLDSLNIQANDLGNSGGGVFDPQQASKSVTVRVKPVNNAPLAGAPKSILATEDKPYHFVPQFDSSGKLISGLQVSDPDSQDYGFSDGIFTVNMSCKNGRLFLNEGFLNSPGVSGNRITYHIWNGEPRQEGRGLHNPTSPLFGDGCQTKIQCSDNSSYTSPDTKYGFFESILYGTVYSPLTKNGVEVGCGFCPENVGNKFLSFDGTFKDINLALNLVTYLPDPNFNTRIPGNSESIVFNVTDNGAIGNDASSQNLYWSSVITVVVESVNDRPIVGRRVKASRTKSTYPLFSEQSMEIITDFSIQAINQSMDKYCAELPPSSDDYYEMCGPQIREFIDIDEDTVFVITPDIFWPHDVDVEEAEKMPSPRRYCCAQNVVNNGGCFCQKDCICLTQLCQCNIPEVCSPSSQILFSPGHILLNISVENGLLSFYPPPGRTIFPQKDLQFLTNQDDKMVPCQDQLACMRNVSWIAMQARLASLQLGIEQLFLVYQSSPDFFGRDKLSIWVSDQGYTDECYNDVLTANQYIDIRVIGVNDPPTVAHPTDVLDYQQGSQCFADYMAFPGNLGLSPGCRNSSEYNIPPRSATAGLKFSDVDMDASPYGNLSVLITIGLQYPQHAFAGNFFFLEILKGKDIWYEQYRNLDGLVTFYVQGNMHDLNSMMSSLRYNADPVYTGFLPIQINANDNYNFGECDGNHTCGQLNPCANHTLAQNHKPVAQGIQAVKLDVVIGVAQICSLQTDCFSCNLIKTCGWCPAACLNSGKCMIGGGKGPQFEACGISRDGRTWRTCSSPVSDLALIVGVSVGALVVFLVALFFYLRWVQRRHGSILRYAKKQKKKLFASGKKLNLLPPEEANWIQFAFLAFFTALLIFAVQFQITSTNFPMCEFKSQYFMDQASSIYLALDTCIVRFVPTRNRGSPDSALPQIMLKMAYTSHPSVKLDAQSCGTNTTFIIQNNRDDSTKYDSYFCNIEVLVPDRIVMPEITIVGTGENITTVRAGPMDQDSPNFGLDFGPNTFSLQGINLVARLENVSAKYFNFDVIHGSLIATDLVVTTFGSFKSEDADLIVTTTQQVHVTFWQKENNLVCLTAAAGSLYADNNCEYVCEYRSQRRSSKTYSPPRRTLERAELNKSEYNSLRRATRRASTDLISFVCSKLSEDSSILNCSMYDPAAVALADLCPVGAQYAKRSQIPRIDGCYDLEVCSLDESAQCLCKLKCDMAKLDPPGTCDGFGRCCQTICTGYSKADLFPEENQPRCGSVIDPVNMPWCNGVGMKQNFKFTSTSGQISLQVLSPDLNSSVSSFNGSLPTADASPTIEMIENDKQILDKLFHPSGNSYPGCDIFGFILVGPGAVESTSGQFVWVKNIHYLILTPWIIEVFSLGLLSYSSISSKSQLKPSFCPAIVDDSSELFNHRLVVLRQLLLKTLQFYPTGSAGKPIPSVSILAYQPVHGLPRTFLVDPSTNKVAVNFVSPADDIMADLFIRLALAIPAAMSFVVVLFGFYTGRRRLSAYREKVLQREEIFTHIHSTYPGADGSADSRSKALKEIKARSGLHAFIEKFIVQSDLQVQKPMWLEFGIVLAQTTLTVLPATIAYVGTNLMKSAYQSQKCKYRKDMCACLREDADILLASAAVNVIIFVYFFSAVWEMSLNYLSFKYHFGRMLLRVAFNFLLFIIIWLSIYYTLTVFVFIFLGLILKPLSSIPYALAVISTGSFFLTIYNNLKVFRVRVERAARKKFEPECEEFSKKLAASSNFLNGELLDTLIESNIEQVLYAKGISESRNLITASIMTFLLVLTYGFLFIGFRAFTLADLNTSASFVNSGIVLAIFAVAYLAAQSERDASLETNVRQINDALKEILGFTLIQVRIATKMLYKVRGPHGAVDGEDENDDANPLL